ncbi:MAG: bifunctional (p)ppGpp synthetase/guanosine-3',5'-bis(diphosphate) 3'-pyrophosphohydrolase [Saprospiraceae bacterium]|nr:bifunctional (p)ppGpp synthetase/guanosine-3',5'-bis(diphosphate) 3'-pyrophosphohydrolase [Saprospiraceae bacterium]MBK8888788.1 bifunctional (p)ppGpp synthetase/guanosine-3',5'-bis(diphosphate) 3'-pyrophosphohydrolase [Saprospiraceae bacterium]MBK9584211.1 bifunctional (p)ppGpp synthetase/guanosine-3',5'-bis(diphosphate) 3'-pyrophosphohydrolase [Saprospiraceae bacterium]MBP6539326.1 bifunctional (p)ppGpp synthetase/guanosine-3',5'-bis(diphosphate) 3'-pyrophosphohydrolase [Saprospiraceae bact
MPVGVAINEDELKQVRAKFDVLLKLMEQSLQDEDRILVEKAYDMAVDAHKYQRRKSGEPYIFHPIEVARICFEEIGLGPTAVVCALLHDVVEDTPVTLQEITETFGPKVSVIVDGLTKLDGTYNTDDVESPQAENFKKVLSTLVVDVRVVLIKMADRLHNLRTIDAQPKHKQLKIAAETEYIYTPLAHRLGLYNIKTEFQDICLKITDPEMYQEISHKLSDSDQARNEYIAEFIKPLKEELQHLGAPFRVLGRSKAISSIYSKIKNNNVTFEEIFDIFAVRIIIDVPIEKEKSYCWQIYSIITDVYKPIPERLKDWVTTPKGNGYESLHTTVVGPKGRYVEVQIRTDRMDEIAEKGFAAHWKYKGIKKQENVYDNWLDNIREILEAKHANAMDFVNDFKTNLFSEEVYVYTPKGDMRIVPKGATALDFAFEIHTDVGYHAAAIKVNNKLVPMGYKLNNGDQVQVITNKNQKPNEDWLKMVVTGKARSKIRSAMKEERRKIGEYGKEALERKLKNLKLDFEENVDIIAKQLGFRNRVDFYYALTQEDVRISDIKNYTIENGKIVFKKDEDEEVKIAPIDEELKKIQRPAKANRSNILVNGEPADMYQFSLATCCNPVQGDEIFAYLTTKEGLKIHRTSCSNATHILANYGYRVLKADWEGSVSNNFVVELLVTGVDSGPGVIQMLTNELSNKLGINIKSFSIEGREGFFEGRIGIVVLNKDQLNLVVQSLERLPGISSVIRTDRIVN